MRYEYKIVLEVDFYGKSYADEQPKIAQNTVEDIKEMVGQLIDRYAKFSHTFCNLRIDAVPHQNDRDYTEEDAKRHCGMTFIEKVKEAFPGVDTESLMYNECPSTFFGNSAEEHCNYFGICDEDDACVRCWNMPMTEDEP